MSVRENRLVSMVITEADTRRAIEETGRGWVVEVEGRVVAFAVADATTGGIWALFVDPEHEGRGYGRQLHDAMLRWLWAQGHERLWLTTQPGTRAERFYERAGWTRVGLTSKGEIRFEIVERGEVATDVPARTDARDRRLSMAQGECNCGAVAFELSAPLSGVFVCHCSICRRFTGSSGIAVVVVDNSSFRWVRGEEHIATWRKPNADWQAWFCRVCGSALPGANDKSRMFVPAGLISEGGEGLKVIHHIWVASKACWDEIGDSGRQHLQGFDG